MGHTASILIVEDDEPLCDLYKERLSLEGWKVFTAGDGETGLAVALTEKPNVVLLDLRLPKLDGYGFLAKAAQYPELRKIPVIVFSALEEEADKARAKKLGAKEFFCKSRTDPKQIVEILKTYV